MSIPSARYIVNGEYVREYTVPDINKTLYESVLRDHLFCPTVGCPSRVSYISGLRPIFKTWNGDDHSDGCIHAFERSRGRVGVDASRIVDVELSSDRKGRSLRDAFRQFNMTAEELANQRERRATNRKNNPTTIERRTQPVARLVLTGGEEVVGEGERRFRGPNLPRRTPSSLGNEDNGETRLIMGLISRVVVSESATEIVVVDSGAEVHVRFEAAFYADSPNFAGLLHLITRFIGDFGRVVFTGFGQVHILPDNQPPRLSVFSGEDFRVNGMLLTTIAAHYARGGFE